ncbi:MAG TPA: HNH endonuclease signature motif containing protein, partial [Polyangiales bacterium]|nr:HNH endonuclease signature motif containing protein [Polyangiales bacterium]
CASLYTYSIYELRFSEDEAFRRVSAARLVRRFPAILDAIASGELHLTGLLLLGPHLTEQNVTEVLARAKHRTKKEILRLVRQLDPLPQVPPRIEPLGPATTSDSQLSRDARALGLEPLQHPVRDLTPGDRPRDWMLQQDSATDAATDAVVGAEQHPFVLAEQKEPPQRYGIQFEATEEYVRLLDEAQALLSHAAPELSLSDLHLRALRNFVAELKRKKCAIVDKPRSASTEAAAVSEPRQRVDGSATETASSALVTRQRGRHIPASVRRAVYQRDAARCTYIDDSGRRCLETHRLEFHHVEPFARGGAHTADNLTLRCVAHNALAAEQDYGQEFVAMRRESAHERLGRQGERVMGSP